MTTGPRRVPWLRRLLSAVLPRDYRAVVLTQLDDEYERVEAAHGARAAAQWSRRQMAWSLPGAMRLRLASTHWFRDVLQDGRYAFRQAFVEINPAFPLVNVGATPLAKFVVTFDQEKLLVSLTSNQKILRLDASPTQLELNNEPKRQASDRRLVPVG